MSAHARPALLAAFDAGRARWSDVALPFDDFTARMEALDVADEDSLSAARICSSPPPARRARAAVRNFDVAFIADLERRVARFRLRRTSSMSFARSRTKLFVGPSPGIRGIAARAAGRLASRHGVRLAIDVGAPSSAATTDVDLLELVAAEQTPELDVARKQYHDRFRALLEDSFKALGAREKTILRLHVVDGLNIDAIAAIYDVHRATVARWLVAIRARVYDRLKQEFAVRWNASSSELRSIVRLLRDHIHITAKRVLDSSP